MIGMGRRGSTVSSEKTGSTLGVEKVSDFVCVRCGDESDWKL